MGVLRCCQTMTYTFCSLLRGTRDFRYPCFAGQPILLGLFAPILHHSTIPWDAIVLESLPCNNRRSLAVYWGVTRSTQGDIR